MRLMTQARLSLTGTISGMLMLLLGACTDKAGGPVLNASDIEANNRGVGLMGYFDYEGARADL